jgi:hypothetical protein
MRILILGAAVLLTAGLAADLALIQPSEVAGRLVGQLDGTAPPTTIFFVGPDVLYRGKHIPGAIYAGPASQSEGLDLLKKAVARLDRDHQIIVYCGCCPWDKCPNIKPAMALLHEMGFTHAKAMFVETRFAKDWTEKGYPVEDGMPRR